MSECESCKFNNPKGTVTALIIRDGELLILKRNQEPHRGSWDLPGGYMQAFEEPEQAMRRELKEELGVTALPIPVRAFPGEAEWKGQKHAVLNHVFLVDIGEQVISLDGENSDYRFTPLADIDVTKVAFDSNRAALEFAKRKFSGFPAEPVKQLVWQLDPSGTVNEQSVYRAILNGHVVKAERNGELVGMGWIFVRQTLLRKQAVIEDMIVDERCRGRGIGREILQELIRWAKEAGVEVVELTSGSHRVAANQLYKSAGFKLHPTNHYLLKL